MSLRAKRRRRTGKHLEHLMDTVLKGKVCLRLAGDIHNYQRHVPASSTSNNFAVDQDQHAGAATAAADKAPTLVISGGGGAFLHPTHCLGHEPLCAVAGTGGIAYTRAAAYPSAAESSALSFQNLLKFRRRNWRFDAIGGVLYLALAHPLFTDAGCDLVRTWDQAAGSNSTGSTGGTGASTFAGAAVQAVVLALSSSTLSMFVFAALWFVTVQAVDSHKQGVRVWLGSAHAFAHVLSACAVFVLNLWILSSLATYTITNAAHGGGGNDALPLGSGGLHLQWNKFTARFPGGASAVAWAGDWSGGLVPAVLRYSMLLADSPNTVYVLHQQMCAGGESSSPSPLSSADFILYWLIRAMHFWVLACPVVSTVLASYLYVSVGWLGMHWNEGFSSLQHTGFKSFVRCRVNESGDLELFCVGLDKCPSEWELDPAHAEEAAAEAKADIPTESCHWAHPSRWKERRSRRTGGRLSATIVDRFVITAGKQKE